MIVWRNGALISSDSAISAQDRGWLLGESVFETILVEDGAPAFLEAHLSRLAVGAAQFGIDQRFGADEIRSALAALTAENALAGRTSCRVTLTRASAKRGLIASPESKAQLVITLAPSPPPSGTLSVALTNRARFSGASTHLFKCGGAYIENSLARRDAVERGCDEGLMLNEHGRLACAAAANFFVVDAAGVRTPPLTEGALPGIVRASTLDAARRLGLRATEAPVMVEEIKGAALLLTNSLIGVVRAALDTRPRPETNDIAATLISAYDAGLAREFERAKAGGS